jgi:hypothetical protein
MRARLYADTGVQIPDIRLVILREPAGTVRIRLNDVVLRRTLDATAGWRDVVHALDCSVRESAFWFMRTSEVRATLAQLADTLPDLVGLVERSYSDPRLTGCLREILRQGDSARNMPRILWLLIQMVDDPDPLDVAITDPILLAGPAEVGRVMAAPAALAAAIRRVDAAETAGGGSGSAPAIVVPPEVESALRGPADSAVRAAAERGLLEVVMAEDDPTQVEVGHADAVPGVRAGLAPLPRPPRVVARQELPLRAPASPVRLGTRPPGRADHTA